jgi:DNA-binding NarL/FixJ family response regulator
MPSVLLLQRDHEASPHLRALIAATGRFEVLGNVHTIAEARPLIGEDSPDVLVTDLRVQDGDVLPFLQELRSRHGGPRPQVLVTLVSHDDTVLLEALRSGADSYWIHANSPDALIASMQQVSRGESPMSPTIARQVLHHFQNPLKPVYDAATEAFNSLALTGTEKQVLEWLAQGYLIDEIATRWQSTVHSVACVVRCVVRKLQFDGRANGLALAA